jgi:anti-sigma regulatory factor (Ser/Thr protein kinase)
MPYYRCPGCGLTSYSVAGHSTFSACPNCSGELPEDARFYPGRDKNLARDFGARPECIAQARRALVGLALPRAARDTLSLLVSELMTNAVCHTGRPPGDPISLRVTRTAGRVRLSVCDGGHGFDRPALEHRDPLAVGGQGLAIVDALSESWGVRRHPDSCTVWCEVAAEDEPGDAMEHEVTTRYVRELSLQLAARS